MTQSALASFWVMPKDWVAGIIARLQSHNRGIHGGNDKSWIKIGQSTCTGSPFAKELL